MYKNTKQQGDFGLGQAIAYFAKMGWVVSIPLTDSQGYDLIVDDGADLLKVQVKTTSQVSPEGVFVLEMRTKGGNKSGQTVKYIDQEIDFVFASTTSGDNYLIPKEKYLGKGRINLGHKVEKYRLKA